MYEISNGYSEGTSESIQYALKKEVVDFNDALL